MSPFVVAFIAFVLLLLFRLLNIASQPRKPEVLCRDDKFAALLKEMAPELEQLYVQSSHLYNISKLTELCNLKLNLKTGTFQPGYGVSAVTFRQLCTASLAG